MDSWRGYIFILMVVIALDKQTTSHLKKRYRDHIHYLQHFMHFLRKKILHLSFFLQRMHYGSTWRPQKCYQLILLKLPGPFLDSE